MTVRIATWNINSIRLRLPLVAQFVQAYQPDVLCLQETKCADDLFPIKELAQLGFSHIEIHGQKAYHGVATLSRFPLQRVETADLGAEGEARHLAVRLRHGAIEPVIHNFYVPAGGDDPDPETSAKFRRKLDYMTSMERWSGALVPSEPMLVVGDLNVAPLETDVWSHKQMLKVVSHTPIEVDHFEAIRRSLDWVDVMRSFVPPEEKLFTWWSYRARDWLASNRGRRLDHIWATPGLSGQARSLCVASEARGWDKPSDHVPVILDLDVG